MSDEPAEAQRKMKYRDHDLPLEDLKETDVESIRGASVRDLAEKRECDRVKVIIGAYLSYLTSKGYRVTKESKMKDLMIDLETLGRSPQTPVISLGAVFFDIETKTLGPTFYMAMDVSEQIARGRKPTGETIKWWLGQSDAAKRVFHEQAKPASVVLTTFVQWYKVNYPKGAYVWGNGSTFDISILEDMFRDYGLPLPWGYNKAMDLRTFKRFKAGGEQIKKSGVNHNALDDAISQAQYVLDVS